MAEKSNFGTAMLMASAALLVIILGAILIVYWRAHKQNKPPYDKHPVSRLVHPAARHPLAA